MKAALIGHPSSGKSTLFRAVAGPDAKGSLAAVPVPDPRFDAIVAQVKPKKATPATVIVDDGLEALQTRGGLFGPKLLEDVRRSELVLFVARAFASPAVPFHAEVDPQRSVAEFLDESLITDLQLVENRLERLARSSTVRTPGSADYADRMLFERIKGPLEEGRRLDAIGLTEDEARLARNYQFLTLRPVVVAVNVSEAAASDPAGGVPELFDRLAAQGIEGFALCASLEAELAALDGEDQADFLASYGLQSPAAARLVQAVYNAMGLIAFFTAGENETRAWSLRRGDSALKAAATIHNDIAKGFIRAEVVSYTDYQAHGSLDAAYKAGAMRLEGKEYVVQDGDLLHIRNKS
jgi:GTP-binding protein YchF